MARKIKQEFQIKQIPTEDIELLQNTLNSMSDMDWDLYSVYEAERNSKIVYNCIFTREVQNEIEEDDDIIDFKSKVERMLYSKEEPYQLCLNLEEKIRDKKKKIERVKKLLENSKDKERDLLNDEIKKEIENLNLLKKDLKDAMSPSKMEKFLGVETLSISLSGENYGLCNINEQNNLISKTVGLRQTMAQELGYILPKVQFIEDKTLSEDEFSINIHGTPVVSAKVYPDYIGYFKEELKSKQISKNHIKTKDVLTNQDIVWINKKDCKNFWKKGIEPVDYITVYLKYYVLKYIEEVFDHSDLYRYIDFVQEKNPYLIESVINDYMSAGEMKYLLCELIKENISIKDIVFIFEKLNDYSEIYEKSEIVEKLRIALSRQISEKFSNKDKIIYAYTISDSILDEIEKQTKKEEDGQIVIDLSHFKKFQKSIYKVIVDILSNNMVILAPIEYRKVVSTIISKLTIDLPVLCYEEISDEYKIEVIGSI